ncbi:hypothetical protein [Puia sp.]|uniref:hypothetical protein n=1 Tax=Puia sp. TaxID=2045100 RepID=UPI002F3E242A
MKLLAQIKLSLVLSVSLFCVLAACKKGSKNSQNSDNYPSLRATTWHLDATQMDIGNGDASWHPATQNQSLQFNKSGKGSIYENGALNTGLYYQVTSDSTMDIKGDSVSQTGHAYFNVLRDTLTISGVGCIEACAIRFVRNFTD